VNGTSGTASAIAVGGHHSCGIQAGTGGVICWGSKRPRVSDRQFPRRHALRGLR
jgi:hypothetical protein